MADADESVLPKGGEVFASTRSYATLTFGWHQTLDSVTATVSKIVKDALPSDVRGSADLTDTVGACCSSELVSYCPSAVQDMSKTRNNLGRSYGCVQCLLS